MRKFILHKPSSTIYLLTKEPTIRYLSGVEAGESIYLKGMGDYGLECCEIIKPRTKVEEFLFNLLWLYQSNIRNKKYAKIIQTIRN